MSTLRKSGAFVFALVVVLTVALSLPVWAIANELVDGASLLEVEDLASPDEVAEADVEGVEADEMNAGDTVAPEEALLAAEEIALTPLANPESDFDYEIAEGIMSWYFGYGAYVKQYIGTSKNVVVPATLGGEEVIYINFYDQGLETLDVSACTALESFNCASNKLSTLDVSKNANLQQLFCWGNRLTSLDVSQNTKLKDFDCSANQITAFDVSKNADLRSLYCHANRLTALDVSNNVNLTYLNCSQNQLKVLDVSKNSGLYSLDCSYNNLTALDISKNTSLTILWCQLSYIADTATLEAWLAQAGHTGQVLPQNASPGAPGAPAEEGKSLPQTGDATNALVKALLGILAISGAMVAFANRRVRAPLRA
ncbi:MAG: LPXTG cell wall anchor domain-containing protein [Eggerthellaceae bacterium]|nr:LPXTG cell wall anchor domain-containing protein [Eggerthellaceae bacterium]